MFFSTIKKCNDDRVIKTGLDALTTPRRKQRGFLWWHSGSPRTPQGLWRRVLCQSIVTSRPKPSWGQLY